MGVSTLRADTIVEMDGTTYRMMREVIAGIWQLEQLTTKRVVEITSREMQCKLADGTLAPQAKAGLVRSGFVGAGIPPQDFEIAKARLAYVRAAMEGSCSRRALTEIIEKVWLRNKVPLSQPSISRVYVWMKRYIAAGLDIHALVDHTQTKGNRDPRFPPKVVQICQDAINQHYLRREGGTIQQVLDIASARVLEENKLLLQSQQLKFPTRRMIKRLIDRIPVFDRDIARMGRDAARMKYRSVKGHVVTDRPLARAEIDHTLIDLIVVDERYGLPLGRPCITVCIDDFTRCVLGVYVGFNTPSYLTVAKCLKHCFHPKVHLKAEFPEIKSEWPSYGVMADLVVDNGMEFHSSSLEEVCGSYGINIQYAARKQGYDKAKVERFLGTLNRAITQGIPGTTFGSISLKGDYDPSKAACVRLSTFRKALYTWIADIYHQEVHDTTHITPSEAWTSNIQLQDVPIPDDMSSIDAIMGRGYKRVLTHKGIEFEGLLYNSPELAELRRRHGDKLDVDIRVDEDDIASIYVLWPLDNKSYLVPALNQAYVQGMNMYLHKEIKERQRRTPTSKEGIEALLEAKQAIQQMYSDDFRSLKKRTRRKVARMLGDERLKEINIFALPAAIDTVVVRNNQQNIDVRDAPRLASEIQQPSREQSVIPHFAPIFLKGTRS